VRSRFRCKRRKNALDLSTVALSTNGFQGLVAPEDPPQRGELGGGPLVDIIPPRKLLM
jgi:hypothetical protein